MVIDEKRNWSWNELVDEGCCYDTVGERPFFEIGAAALIFEKQ